MNFHFEKTVRDRGRQGLKGTFVITLVFGAIDLYMLHQPVQIGHVVGTWFAGLLILFSSLMTLWCLLMIRSNERWKVSVNDQGIIWQTPKNDGEPNFQYSLSELKHICLIASTGPAIPDEYQLHTTAGNSHRLIAGNGSIPVNEVVSALEANGIPQAQSTL